MKWQVFHAEAWLIFLQAGGVAFADTLTVGQGGGYQFGSIQAAINAASDLDKIVVAPGTYVENINFLGKAVTVRSSDGPDVTTIDGNQSGSVVTFDHNELRDSILDGFTIANGSATRLSSHVTGGGIFCNQSSSTIANCIIRDNIARDIGTCCVARGGGIGVYGSPYPEQGPAPALLGCTIMNNLSEDYGGGIYLFSNWSLSMSDCNVMGNSGESGGGVKRRLPGILNDNYSSLPPNPAVVDFFLFGSFSFFVKSCAFL